MKRKKMTVAISAIVGVVVLSTAAFANYGNANGYEAYKKALKGFVAQENYTLSMEGKIEYDGQELAWGRIDEKYDKNGDVKLNQKTQARAMDENGGAQRSHESYYQDGMRISQYERGNGNVVTSVDDNPNPYPNIGNVIGIDLTDERDKEIFDKTVRFMELGADMFIGDLKNNFVLTSEENGNKTYAINLDSVQIPELVNAGLSLAATGSTTVNSYDSVNTPEASMSRVGTDTKVESANCYVTLDSEGRILENKLDATVTGKDPDGAQHAVKMQFSFTVSDYGTTQPERVDLDSMPNVQYASKYVENRISELQKILKNDELSEKERESYEEELESLKEGDVQDASISVTSDGETMARVEVTNPDGSKEVRLVH